jgi:arylsulfatase
LLIAVVWHFSPPAHQARATGARPNVVLMMADDMGYSDIGCYGGEIATPNLNRLAEGGLRFTQFYNTARCCPTRAALMTGLYQHQAGVGHMTADKGFDAYRGDLNTRCVTIAEVLRPAGYGTYMSGKWHVTKHTKPEGPKFNWPLQRGYSRYFGTISGAGSYWTPATLTDDNTQIEPPAEGFYYTNAIADHAATFIADHHQSRPDDPLFIYVPFTSPHWPLHAPRKDVERYLGKYSKGWDALRAERHERMIAMGIVDASWPLTPRDEAATAWDQLDAEKKKEMDLRMAVYAAQIDVMDQGIGRIVAALEKTGRLENTLIFFLADNGGCAEGGPWGFERKEGGLIGEDNSFASYGLSWANASNTPFRLYKHWVHEGGISTPLIVHWPAGFTARGEFRRQSGHLIDIMATCVDVSGAKYPETFNGNPILPMEGKSLAPAFRDEPIQREAIYWEHEGNRAVRRGKWKLVSKHPGGWELYDIEADRTELNDLAEKHPDVVAELSTLWEAWAARCGVQPWPVGGGKPKKKAGSKQTEFNPAPVRPDGVIKSVSIQLGK